jgi:hypothetical protein
MTVSRPTPHSVPQERRRIRLVFLSFLLTFIAARVLVFLIMARRIPDLYAHFGGTHVHHLNYGIFLLALVGAILLFADLSDHAKRLASLGYGIGLALTFDEFGMWLHLGGGYWQRASFDTVIVLASLLGLLAYAPPLRNWHRRQVLTACIACIAAALFYLMLAESFRFAADIELRLTPLEQRGPT